MIFLFAWSFEFVRIERILIKNQQSSESFTNCLSLIFGERLFENQHQWIHLIESICRIKRQCSTLGSSANTEGSLILWTFAPFHRTIWRSWNNFPIVIMTVWWANIFIHLLTIRSFEASLTNTLITIDQIDASAFISTRIWITIVDIWLEKNNWLKIQISNQMLKSSQNEVQAFWKTSRSYIDETFQEWDSRSPF